MFTRILVPLEGTMDGSAREEQTFAAARCLAEREGAQLVLLHVDADAASAQAATRAEMLDRSQPR
ncbi:MAG TPA: universal stress protein [Ktedonobacterales bacterium]